MEVKQEIGEFGISDRMKRRVEMKKTTIACLTMLHQTLTPHYFPILKTLCLKLPHLHSPAQMSRHLTQNPIQSLMPIHRRLLPRRIPTFLPDKPSALQPPEASASVLMLSCFSSYALRPSLYFASVMDAESNNRVYSISCGVLIAVVSAATAIFRSNTSTGISNAEFPPWFTGRNFSSPIFM